MNVAVASTGPGLEAEASPTFGRCPMYVLVDTKSMHAESIENAAANAPGGAGIQAAQSVLERGAQAVIAGRVGPNAMDVFNAAQVGVFSFDGGTVRQAVEAYKASNLQPATAGPAGRDSGSEARSSGSGMGRGGGRGRGVGRGMGRAASMGAPAMTSPLEPMQEVAELKQELADLRKQLAAVLDKLDQMQSEA